jgi:hypothetical protein
MINSGARGTNFKLIYFAFNNVAVELSVCDGRKQIVFQKQMFIPPPCNGGGT